MQTVKLPAMRDFYPRPPGGGRPASLSRQIYESKNFYPRPPGGGRRDLSLRCRSQKDFYPRPPGGGRHSKLKLKNLYDAISIHALRVEGDVKSRPVSRHPLIGFLSTPSGWRATLCFLWRNQALRVISIHALRVEGDRCGAACKPGSGNDFYPRPPGGGRPRG